MNTETKGMEANGSCPDIPEKIRRMIDEQGVAQTATFEHLYGAGADLWDSDEDFERFVEIIAQRRRESE